MASNNSRREVFTLRELIRALAKEVTEAIRETGGDEVPQYTAGTIEIELGVEVSRAAGPTRNIQFRVTTHPSPYRLKVRLIPHSARVQSLVDVVAADVQAQVPGDPTTKP